MGYYEIPVLSNVYLEDSYVMAIHEYDDRLVFVLDVVLTEKHPSYQAPQVGEQYCYKRATLCFLGVRSVEWIRKQYTPFTDATGENDYGNIDSFTKDGQLCFLTGDWGEVGINCSSVELTLIE